MPKFTVEQQKAIDDRNVNILVAAAAGSGKTTILVERIKKLIIEENCSLENMLVVTFTELAAKEMKEKIIKAIDNAVFDADDSLRQRLKKELAIIPNANISTFHSFALEIIRKFYYLIGIEPNLKIIDDIQKNILLTESMEELTDYYFKKEDRRFIEFLNCYTSGKNISAFGEMVSAVYNKIMAMAEPFEWLKESIALSSLTKDEFIKSPQFKSFISGITAKLDTYLDFIETKIRWAEGENLDTLIGYLEPERAILSELKQMLQEERYNEISEYKPAAKKNISKIKGQIHAGVNLEDIVLEAREDEREFISKKICNAFFFDSMEHMVEDMNKTVPHLEFLEEAVRKYHEIFCKKKAKKAYMTFNDIEHYAFEILKHGEAAAYYRDKFEHIFIDEFQDTNGVQFAITSLFAREDNLFMVGDVKQSIYRFRQADPTLFEERYNTFKELEKNDPKGSRSEAIDLNANFRSRRSVVEYVNTIFSDVMENYDDNAKLNGKCLTYDEPAQDARLYLLENEGMMSDSSDDSTSGDEASNSILEMSNTQKEALATVKLINEYKRRFGYQNKDFAILLRSVKNRADIYYETLAENNIASYINDNDGYFDTIEINTLCAFLSVIDNEMQDVELLTAMRSEFFGFTIKELADIRIHHTSGSYYSSVRQYAEDGTDQGLKEKCLNLLSVLEKYRRLSYILPLEELIWDILLETGFYISMGALPNGARRQANLRALIDKAQNYRENYNGQLYGFISYIDSVKENKIELGQVKLLSEDDDVVKIMTIHKSKGLEFPVVILSGFSSRLNYRGEASNLAMDKELGLALSYVDFEKSYKRNTILKNMISYKYIKDAVDEEKRVLYVAMTRAEQVLAVLGSTKDYDKTVNDLKSNPTKNTNYLAMTGKSMLFRNLPVKKLSLSDIQDISEKKESDTRALIEMMDREPSQVDSEIDALMNFRYGYRDELEVKSKYSVSELNAEGTGTYRRISIPRSVSGRKNFTRAEIGTITHKVLFMLDLKRCESEKEAYVDELLKTMVKEEILTEEETSAVDRASLITFAESEIGKRMSESSRVYREQAFNLQIPVNGVYTLAQGIIDCFFYEDDGIVLIDYKTTEKSDEEYIRNEYRKQIALYKEAIEKAKKVRVKESYLHLTNFSKLIKMDDC